MPTLPMENVKYDGVGTMQPRPLALEHDNYVDVEKEDKVKAPIVDVIAETRDQIIHGLEEREARAR